jgi:hypothetical protein
MDASAMEIGASDEAGRASNGRTLLDSFVGHYRRGHALGVSTITRRDSRLILEPIGQPPVELEQIGDAEFALRSFELVLRFEQIEDGVARRLVIWRQGVMFKLERIDADTAERLRRAVAQRVETPAPLPGGESALRQMIDGRRTGAPDYTLMAPDFAQTLRGQLPYWQAIGQYFGAIVYVEFVGVTAQGWDCTGCSTSMTCISTASC